MATAPLEKRVLAADGAPKGFMVQTGVAALRSALAGHAAIFAEWRRDKVTRRVVGALQDLLMHMPPEVSVQDSLVQYGFTQGLALAIQLCNDPSLIWPDIFGKDPGARPGDLPSMEFETSLDEALDS